MRSRRWLVVAVFLSLVAAACGNSTSPSAAPGSTTASSAAPAGSPPSSDVLAIAARVGDTAALQQIAAELRAQRREQLGIAQLLGPQGAEALAALDALELSMLTEAAANAPGQLAGNDGTTGTVSLASYQGPRGSGAVTHADLMTLAIVGIFLEPMVEAAHESGKTPFDKKSTETKPGSGSGHSEKGTFTWRAIYSGGLLTATFEGSFSATTGTGAEAKTQNESFSYAATIRPCPDGGGKVPIDLTYTSDSTTTGPGENVRDHLKITMNAVVTVDDNAEVAGTAVSADIDASTGKTTVAGVSTEGGQTSSMTFGLGADGVPTDMGISSIENSGDDASATSTGAFSRLAAVLVSPAIGTATKTARKGWRNDKCVELKDVTPESKEVGQKEKVDIAATLKHRVTDEEVQKKVKATVQGAGTVDPAEADGPKVKYVYTAGEHFGDKGTVEIKSVSNRGIATKNLTFSIRGKWTLAAHGTFSQMLGASAGGFAFGAELTVKVDPFPLAVDEAGQVTGKGTIHFSGHPAFPPGTPCTGSYESTETLNVTGTQGTDANGASMLTLHFSAPPGTVNSTIDCPGGIGGSTQFNMAGGFGGNLTETLSYLPGIAVPAAGGSVSIDQKGTSSVWTTHAVLTFELIVAESAP